MWTTIYLTALSIFIIPMGFFTLYAWSWLQSIGNPQTTAENFTFWSGISWTFLWLSTIVLLILANVALWKTRRAWMLWTTAVYFAVFIVAKYFWLDAAFKTFRAADGFSAAPLFGAVLCLLGFAIVFFDQFIVLRLTEKMHPPALQPPLEELPEENLDEREKFDEIEK